jgi:Tetratricopeptide repeat
MRRGGTVSQPIAVFLSLMLSRAVVAQPNHLPALRDWQYHQEQAARYLQQGYYAKAEERLNLAIKNIRPYLPDTRRIMAKSYCDLARVLYHQKRYAEGEPLARWALSVRESDKQSNADAVFQCVYVLGLIQSARKQHVEAEQLLKRALALQDQNLGQDHINSIFTLDQLTKVYIEQAKFGDAESLYLRSIAIYRRKAPDENLDLAETAEKYAKLLRLMKRNTDADEWDARARKIRDTAQTKAAKAQADRAAEQFKGFK